MFEVSSSHSRVAAPEMAELARAARWAVHNAAGALSEMACRDIEARSTELARVPLARLATVGGDPEGPVVAVYVGMEGAMRGHILMAFSEAMARGLVDMLLGEPAGTTIELDEMAVSALAESGNVAGSAFLNTLANWADLKLPPMPPVVVYEMRGAILSTLAADLALRVDEALMIESQFSCDGQVVDVDFFMFPGEEMIRALTGPRRPDGTSDADHRA